MSSARRQIARNRLLRRREMDRIFKAAAAGLEQARAELLMFNVMAYPGATPSEEVGPLQQSFVLIYNNDPRDRPPAFSYTLVSSSVSARRWADMFRTQARLLVQEMHMDDARLPESVDLAISQVMVPEGFTVERAVGFPPLVIVKRGEELVANVAIASTGAADWKAAIEAVLPQPELQLEAPAAPAPLDTGGTDGNGSPVPPEAPLPPTTATLEPIVEPASAAAPAEAPEVAPATQAAEATPAVAPTPPSA